MVSVIIPCYNCQEYIVGSMNSIEQQTFQDFEVILIDDGSTDGTLELLRQQWGGVPRVQILASEVNQGPGPARNIGIKAAKGKYLVFVDSDDRVERLYLETMYLTAERERADFVCCGAWRVGQDGRKDLYRVETGDMQGGWQAVAFLQDAGVLPVMWAAMVSRTLVRKHSIWFTPTMNEDLFFKYRLLYHCQHLVSIKDPLYDYVIRAESSFETPDPYFDSFCRMLGFVRQWLDDVQKIEPLSEKRQEQVCHFFLRADLSHLLRFENGSRTLFCSLLKKYLQKYFGEKGIYISTFLSLYREMEKSYQEKNRILSQKQQQQDLHLRQFVAAELLAMRPEQWTHVVQKSWYPVMWELAADKKPSLDDDGGRAQQAQQIIVWCQQQGDLRARQLGALALLLYAGPEEAAPFLAPEIWPSKLCQDYLAAVGQS